VVAGAMKNPFYEEGVRRMAEMVEGGRDLSFAMRQTRLFPYHIADMISVGEKGGNLEEMLDNISESCEAAASQRLTALTSLVEPFIILVLGAFVAFVLVSTLLPLFEMNRLILKG
jgi:type II secretory pathway component PulF